MALILRGTTKFGTETGYFRGSPTGAKPTGTVEGDLIVIWMSGDINSRPSVSWPSGFTAIYDQNDTDLGGGSWIYGAYKVAGASEPSTYTVSISGVFYRGGSKCSIISYYNDAGVGSWSLLTRAANKVRATSITSPSVTGTGLYMIPFIHEATSTVSSNNSPVPSILFDNATSNSANLSSQIYAGYLAVTAGTVSITWSSRNDLYSLPTIFQSNVAPPPPPPTGYVSKIKINGAYKNVLNGWVAVDQGAIPGSATSWKQITGGYIKVGDGQKGSWKEIFID